MKLIILSKFVMKSTRDEMQRRLRSQGFDDYDFIWMGCFSSSYDGTFSKSDLKEARAHFWEVVGSHHADCILAMGNESLYVCTGHSGIMNWRGHIFHEDNLVIMPTIALGAIERNPGQIQLLYADIRGLYSELHGDRNKDDRPKTIRVIKDEKSLEAFQQDCKSAQAVAYDLETSSFNELAADSFIVSAAFTLCHTDDSLSCWALPLCHAKSPCKTNWTSILRRASWAV